jgi:predicted transcriptional regulator
MDYNYSRSLIKWRCIVLISTVDILNALADYNALVLFRTIAATRDSSNILISKMNLSRKQYYSRMSRLMNAGLVKRQNGKYILTSLGKVIHEAEKSIETALVHDYWKLKTIDSLETCEDLPMEELHKIIESLIKDQKIKESVLVNRHNARELTFSLI